MILQNKTKRTRLTEDLIPAHQLKKIRGLMGVQKPQALLLKTHFGIHTFFLKFPIDVIVLGKEYKVVKVKQNLKPWSVYIWNPKYGTVIELPEKTIKSSKTELGDRLIVT